MVRGLAKETFSCSFGVTVSCIATKLCYFEPRLSLQGSFVLGYFRLFRWLFLAWTTTRGRQQSARHAKGTWLAPKALAIPTKVGDKFLQKWFQQMPLDRFPGLLTTSRWNRWFFIFVKEVWFVDYVLLRRQIHPFHSPVFESHLKSMDDLSWSPICDLLFSICDDCEYQHGEPLTPCNWKWLDFWDC